MTNADRGERSPRRPTGNDPDATARLQPVAGRNSHAIIAASHQDRYLACQSQKVPGQQRRRSANTHSSKANRRGRSNWSSSASRPVLPPVASAKTRIPPPRLGINPGATPPHPADRLAHGGQVITGRLAERVGGRAAGGRASHHGRPFVPRHGLISSRPARAPGSARCRRRADRRIGHRPSIPILPVQLTQTVVVWPGTAGTIDQSTNGGAPITGCRQSTPTI